MHVLWVFVYTWLLFVSHVILLCHVGEGPIPMAHVNYYSRFLPNKSARLASLYQLLWNNCWWYWSSEQEKAFKVAKEALQSESLLVHYDSSMPIVLTCDALPYMTDQ